MSKKNSRSYDKEFELNAIKCGSSIGRRNMFEKKSCSTKKKSGIQAKMKKRLKVTTKINPKAKAAPNVLNCRSLIAAIYNMELDR